MRSACSALQLAANTSLSSCSQLGADPDSSLSSSSSWVLNEAIGAWLEALLLQIYI